MIKKIIVVSILFFIFSCSRNSEAIMLDSYFNELYSVTEGKGLNNIVIINPLTTEEISLEGYSKITVTSLLYENLYTLFEDFEGEIQVVDYYGELKAENHKVLNPSYTEFTKNLRKDVFIDEDLDNICIIATQGMELGVDNNVFFVGKRTTKRDISAFIKNNEDKKWVVLNASYLNFINQELDKKSRIMIESSDLMKFHETVLASIDKRLRDIVIDGATYNVEIKKR